MTKNHILLVIVIAASATVSGCDRAEQTLPKKKTVAPSEIKSLSTVQMEAVDVARRYVKEKKLNREYALHAQPVEEAGAYWAVYFDDVKLRDTNYIGHGLTIYVNKSTMSVAWFLYNQ